MNGVPLSSTDVSGERFPNNERSRRRARAAIGWAFAFYAAAQFGTAILLQSPAAVRLRDPVFGAKLDRLLRIERRRPAGGRLVLALGSSQTDNAIDGARLGASLGPALGHPVTVFNFGYTGGGPVTERLLMERLLRSGVKPDFVLIEVMPADLSQPGDAVHLRPERLMPGESALINRFGGALTESPKSFSDKWLIPIVDSRFVLVNRWLPDWVPGELRWTTGMEMDEHGWMAFPSPTPERRERALRVARDDYTRRFGPDSGVPGAFHWSFPGPGCAALEELLERLRDKGIPAALLLLPEGPLFRSWYSSAIDGQVMEYLRRVSIAHGAPLADARDWLPEEAFVDSHHLLPPGADAFSLRLGREHLVDWLRRADAHLPLVDVPPSTY